jgi:SnoaL-like domain
MKNSCPPLIALALGTILSMVTVRPAVAQRAMPSPESTVEAYCQAWGTADRAARDRLLAQVWAPNGTYTDPESTVVKGRTALSDEIATFLRNYPGGHFRCSTPQVHHQAMRFAWVLLRPDGTRWAQGMDFGELADDGRIRRIVGFFGPLPVVAP